MIKRIEVESSNIKSVGYSQQDEVLEVEFQNGSVYQYERVPQKTHRELMEAESVGKYFAKHIKHGFN